MKLKETKSGNIKITFTPFELETVMSVLNYVRLGVGERSDVIFDLSTLVFDACLYMDVDATVVSFEQDADKDTTINVS